MREFFIGALDRVIGFIVILMGIGVLIAAFGTMSGGVTTASGASIGGGIGLGLFVLIVGALYVVLMAGFMYLGLGIYHNTKRTAEATEKMASRG